MDPKNILVIAVARFGDTLLITPVLHALKQRWPNAHIHVFAHKRSACILEHNPDIDCIRPFSKKEQFGLDGYPISLMTWLWFTVMIVNW